MINTFLKEYRQYNEALEHAMHDGRVTTAEYARLAAGLLELLAKAEPEHVLYKSRLGECHHLDGYLRKAGEAYSQVLEQDPPLPVTEDDIRLMKRFCPVLLTQADEPFPLKDIVAIHHPELPIIGYHLFWEDDYDFPDDHEPCDHEEVWISYDPASESVTGVLCWFHSRVLSSESGVEEANQNGGRAVIRIEWGKHGSLLHGWEHMRVPLTGQTILEWLGDTYEQVKNGGRKPEHPLKKLWPSGFAGSWEQYTDFSVCVDPVERLDRKPLFFKTRWANAVMFIQAIHYNFHPKMEWPARFQA
ncbi:hypothetical protein [Paenibacillus thalictri]|uniref:Tetratricopeptide repeat protein n=1 Tax=Paenibacillus thalictri TaxID=2527873 RepID=A0A4Q9DML4_9BACL|nr:hypothetical protein [Paenibacillus thalictri]TBL75339.1 hypothetical protein EYB31_23305 [Paenibacillus thalictri]